MKKYIAFDVETSGIKVKKSELLTAYFAVLDQNYRVIDELELYCKPNSYYKINPSAMNINKICLIKHDQKAIPYKDAGLILKRFIENNKEANQKLVPIGHRFNFDVKFLSHFLLKNWHEYVEITGLDTASIAVFLKSTKALPENFSISLARLAEHFNISNTNSHEAKFDTHMTIQVLKVLQTYSKKNDAK